MFNYNPKLPDDKDVVKLNFVFGHQKNQPAFVLFNPATAKREEIKHSWQMRDCLNHHDPQAGSYQHEVLEERLGPSKQFIRTEVAQKFLGFKSAAQLNKLVKTKQLRCSKPGRLRFFRTEDLQVYRDLSQLMDLLLKVGITADGSAISDELKKTLQKANLDSIRAVLAAKQGVN